MCAIENLCCKRSIASAACCRLLMSSRSWLACGANIYRFPFCGCVLHSQCIHSAKCLFQALVSTGRDKQRPPPESVPPPQCPASKFKLTAIDTQNTWVKAEEGTLSRCSRQILCFSGFCGFVNVFCEGNSSAISPSCSSTFSNFVPLFLWYCTGAGASVHQQLKLSCCCSFIVYIFQGLCVLSLNACWHCCCLA